MQRAQMWRAVGTVGMGLLYGVSPIDLVPDVIPLIGWVDDAILVPLLVVMGVVQYRRARRAPATSKAVGR